MRLLKPTKNNVVTHRQEGEKASRQEILTVYKRILTYVMKYWVLLIIGIVSIILSSAVDAGLTYSFKPLIDKGLIAKDMHFINMLPFFVLLAFLLRGSTAFFASYTISAISRKIIMVMRQQVFSHLLKLPASYYDQKTSGNLIAILLYNVDQVAAAGASTLIILVRETFFVVGLLFVMCIASWQLSLLFLITAPFIAISASYSSKKMRNYSRKVQDGMGDISHIAEEAIEGYKVIRTFGGESYEVNKFNKATWYNFRKEMKLVVTNSLSSPLVQLIVAIVIAVTIYLASKHAGNITPGGFATIIASMLAILKPLKNITTINNTIQRGVIGAEGVFELLDVPAEIDQGTQTLQRATGKVEFKDIVFAYANHPDKKVLNHINLTIQPGETIALVGKSGSGKTSLVNLLPRFYDNYQGDIVIDNINIRDITLESLRTQFAFVSQHVTLFNDTIAHNIAYGKFSEMNEAEIIAAAKAANAWEFIESLPQGIHTRIGENGLLLSGGQRQRIAIARALLKDAPILILDEATSSLDTESERYIQDALQRLIKNRTTLIIAHRLTTIEKADKIFVMKEGRIVEAGSHQELIAHNGEYARLHSMQFREEIEENLDLVTA